MHVNVMTVLYLSISIALLTAWAFQKRSPTTPIDTVSEFTRRSGIEAIVSEGLAQGPYLKELFSN